MTYILYLFVLVEEGSAMCVAKGLVAHFEHIAQQQTPLAGTGWKPYLHSDWLKHRMANRKENLPNQTSDKSILI